MTVSRPANARALGSPNITTENVRSSKLRSETKAPTKHTILNRLKVELARDGEEETLTFQDVDSVTAEDAIRELERIESISKRLTYNSHFSMFKLVIMPTSVHEAHFAWLVHEIRTLSTLTLQEKLMPQRWRRQDGTDSLRPMPPLAKNLMPASSPSECQTPHWSLKLDGRNHGQNYTKIGMFGLSAAQQLRRFS